MTSRFDSSRLTLLAIMSFAILIVLIVVAREVYRAAHPRTKPTRKRKRKTF